MTDKNDARKELNDLKCETLKLCSESQKAMREFLDMTRNGASDADKAAALSRIKEYGRCLDKHNKRMKALMRAVHIAEREAA